MATATAKTAPAMAVETMTRGTPRDRRRSHRGHQLHVARAHAAGEEEDEEDAARDQARQGRSLPATPAAESGVQREACEYGRAVSRLGMRRSRTSGTEPMPAQASAPPIKISCC